MSKHIIFVFTGTGNSLWAAKEIAKSHDSCEIVSMGSSTEYFVENNYDTIGFVYPTYYRGAPVKVREFVSNLDLRDNKNAYVYAVVTCGNISCSRNSIVHLQELLNEKGVSLSYAEHLAMFPNYIIMYDMRDAAKEETERSAIGIQPIIKNIRQRG